MRYKGITPNGKIYIVSYIDTEYPYRFIVKFPDCETPIRVDFALNFGSPDGSRGHFMIPSESHESWDTGWQVIIQMDKMLLAEKSFGDIVFLEATNDYTGIETNFTDFPDDIFDFVEFVEFDDFYVVRYNKKYHATKKDYNTYIDIWSRDTHTVTQTKVINEELYRDGGTFIAKYEVNKEEHNLYIPTKFKKCEPALLNDKLQGKVISQNDDEYWQLWREFRKDSGLKLYYVNDKMLNLNYGSK